MSKTEELQAAAVVTKTKLPPVTTRCREAIDEFLRHYLERIERSCNNHRVIAMTDRTDRLQGIILFQKHQVATLRTLIASNLARRASEPAPRSKRSK